MFNNLIKLRNGRTTGKILAAMLVITLTFANFALLGTDTTNQTNEALKENNSTNVENVKFDVYVGKIGQKQIAKDINDNDLLLGIMLKVENGGYFSEGELELQSTNFRAKNNQKETKFKINTIQSGTGITPEIVIVPIKSEDFNLSLLNMISTIKLTGKYTNNEGEVTNVEATKNIQVIWNSQNISKENNPIKIEQEIITNTICNVAGTNKRVIQLLVKSGLNGNCYPIKDTNIKVFAPKLVSENEYPEEVLVASYDTIATNGKNSTEFGKLEENKQGKWNYDEEQKIINIDVQNQVKDNTVKWEKSGEDKFVVTYIYNEQVDVTEVSSRIDNTITLYGDENVKITNTSDVKFENKEEKNNIISLDMETPNSLYKSYIKLGQKMEYEVNHIINVGCSKVYKEMMITTMGETFTLENNEIIDANTYYEATYINKEELLNLIGTDGIIEIAYTDIEEENNTININAETETDENGIITINYGDKKPYELYIGMSAPVSEGKLNITHKKVIDGEGIENEKISKFNTNTYLMAIDEQEQELEIIKESEIMMENPKTEIQLGIDKTNLSITQNSNVNFTVTLKTNDIKYDLFSNPVLEIILPEEVEKVDIKNSNILNANGLTLNSVNSEENKIIKIQLSGKQEEYTGEDTQILINADIQLKRILPTLERELVLKCVNNKETVYANPELNYAESKLKINLIAEQGILLVNSISNYNGSEPEVIAFKNEKKVATLNEKADKDSEAVVKGIIINNTESELNNVIVIGKIFDEDSKINTSLASGVNIGGAQVYYTKDKVVSKDSNWAKEYSEDITGYKIEIVKIDKAQIIDFTYNLKIPATIENSKEFKLEYELYNGEQAIESPTITLQTKKDENGDNVTIPGMDEKTEIDENAKLSLEFISNVEENQVVLPGQEIIYTANITNISYIENEVIVKGDISEGLVIDSITKKEGENDISVGTSTLKGFSVIEKIKANNTMVLTIKAHVDKEIKSREIINKITAYIMLPRETDLTEEEETKVSEISKELKHKVDVKVDIENIIIPESIKMKVGETRPLEIMLEPSDATIEDVEIKVEQDDEDLNVISIDEKLNISALNPGNAFIVVTSKSDSNIQMKTFVEVVGAGENGDNEESNGNGENQGDSGDEEENNGDQGNSGEESGEKTYKISGFAWLDEDDDGIREEDEKLLKGILVKIKDFSTNEYIKDSNNKELEAITDENGRYEFTNLKVGSYIVEFNYNQQKYRLTKTTDKDSLANLVTQEGINKIVTDRIRIINGDIENINIGLNLNSVFDLQLDKYISRVIVQNGSETKTYNYGKEKLAKIEIDSKKLNGSTVIIEYTIAVTNNGTVPGYAKNIIDYISPDLKFNSEMNVNWYQGLDNNLYCEELEKTVVNPGETKEVKLILTKKMTNKNTGLVNNSAEIYESYNEYALEDINSLEGNNKEKENDYSVADIIISVKTGKVAAFIGITIALISILSVGIYLINIKIIKRRNI